VVAVNTTYTSKLHVKDTLKTEPGTTEPSSDEWSFDTSSTGAENSLQYHVQLFIL